MDTTDKKTYAEIATPIKATSSTFTRDTFTQDTSTQATSTQATFTQATFTPGKNMFAKLFIPEKTQCSKLLNKKRAKFMEIIASTNYVLFLYKVSYGDEKYKYLEKTKQEVVEQILSGFIVICDMYGIYHIYDENKPRCVIAEFERCAECTRYVLSLFGSSEKAKIWSPNISLNNPDYPNCICSIRIETRCIFKIVNFREIRQLVANIFNGDGRRITS